MKLLSQFRDLIGRCFTPRPSIDEAEINIFGINAKLVRKISIPTPHEFSVFIPRLEFNKTITEGSKTSEISLILNSLTMVSSPVRESSEPHPGHKGSRQKAGFDRSRIMGRGQE